MTTTTHRAWVEVDLGALQRNARLIAQRAGVPLLPMIKADAYGVGAIEAARALEPLDPWGFGVATVAEGEELRRARVERPIVVFSPLTVDDYPGARNARLTPTLGSAAAIEAWCASGGGAWHLAIDTGMSRAGIGWREIDSVLDMVRRYPPEGVFTHFHSAERNDHSLEAQERRFVQAVAKLPARPAILHAENSPALERRTSSTWNVVRPGIFMYGAGSGEGALVEPEQVVRMCARIVEVRCLEDGDTVSYGATYRAVGRRRVATAAIGYGDGYRRSLGNRGSALVRGRRVPVAGWVTMDMTMLDVTDAPCEVGDVATFIGADGSDCLRLEEVGRVCDLSPYELLIGLRLRLPRIYLDSLDSA